MPPVSFVAVRLSKRFLLAALLALALGGAALLARVLVPALTWHGPAVGVRGQPAAVLAAARPGEPAPQFTLVGPDGKTVSLAALRGRPVILYFWATWCRYCQETLPELQALRHARSRAGLEVLAVNILESSAKVRAYLRQHGISLPVLLDHDGRVSQLYAVRATPSYYLIDPEGVLRDVLIGAVPPEELAARLESLLSSED